MIVKGLIKTINFSDNSCTVRLPIFETAASQGEVILKAVMLTQPGLYNGYSEGDIVFVDFENDKLNQPIILGKLYLGAAKEEASPVHSSLAVSNLTVTSKATLPIDTQLVLEDTGNMVAVENGITTYKSLTDIIKALYKTEASVDKTTKDQAETIANIKVEYLSQLASQSAPEATDTNWDISTPDYKDGFAIWQKTTCYNHRGQVLSREIICLNSINSSATYRLRCSTRVHAGASQTEKLIIKAMVKIGSSLEVEDASAILKYKWSGEDDKDATIEKKSNISFSNSDLEDKNLIVELLHEDLNNPGIYNTYDTETIMYAPLNTPVIHFSKDTDVILYTADGEIKLGDDVENTAELYINGDILPAEFTWSWVNCTCDYNSETNPDPKTIIVTGFTPDSRTGIATCKAKVTQEGAFKDKEYEKEFAVTQTRVGENATSYWLVSSCTVHTGKKHGEAITITAMQQFGTSTEGVDIAARLWWKYKNKASNSWKLATDKDEDGEDITYRLVLAFNDLEDDDILVLATHDITFDPTAAEINIATDPLVYEREEITFSPLNTPILSLTNDSGAILYGSNGQKMNLDDTVSTTAELFLNGTKLPDENITYTWEPVNCTIAVAEGKTEEESLTSPTITIEDLSENTASAICTATYKDEPYTKTFTVVKQIQGISIVSQTTYYALVHDKFPYEDIPSGNIVTLIPPADKDNLAVYIQKGDDIITKRLLKRLDQATTSTDIDEAETWSDWSTTPPAHTEDTNGWKFWTTVETIYSSGAVSFSNPIINEDLSGVYALAQGKSTNYYSDDDPAGDETDIANNTYGTARSSKNLAIKEGDCWFNTGYKEVSNYSTFELASAYIGKYIAVGEEKIKVTPGNVRDLVDQEALVPKVTPAYSRGELYQWSGGSWEEISDELVTNKLTANYINALDITAKKIKILDDTSNTTLFEADGLDGQHKVTIAGFEVSSSGLYTTDFGNSYDNAGISETGVYLGKDGLKLGKTFSVDDDGNVIASSLKISSDKTINAALQEAQEAAEATAQTNLMNAFTVNGGTTLGDTWLSTTSVYAQNLSVANADITNQILVGPSDNPILYANVNDADNVKIGGFTVGSTRLNNGTNLNLATADLPEALSVASRNSTDWRITVGNKFGISSAGILYADGAKFINAVSPVTSGGGTLGSTTYRWGNIFGANIDAQGTLISRDANGTTLFGTDMNGNTVLKGQLHASGQIITDAQVFSSGAIISYNPTTDTTTNGNTVTVNPRILLNPDGYGQIRCRGGVYVYADDKSITGKLDASDPMHTTGTGPWPMFAVDNNGEVWAKKVHFSQGGSSFYEPVISVADGNSNSVYTTMVDIATDVTGGDVIYAQWKKIRLPGAFQMTDPHATNDKVKGVFLTGFLSDSHVDTSTTVSGDCGSTSTETGTALNIGAQGMTHYVRWDAGHVYVLIPKKITIDSTITSKFDIKLCLLIVGNISK